MKIAFDSCKSVSVILSDYWCSHQHDRLEAQYICYSHLQDMFIHLRSCLHNIGLLIVHGYIKVSRELCHWGADYCSG